MLFRQMFMHLRLIIMIRIGGKQNEKNLSAQKTSQENGARLPQENGRQKRPQGSLPPQGKRQKAALLLISPVNGSDCFATNPETKAKY